jgi:hypothetical protein
MLLNQSNAIGLAKASCLLCQGLGVRIIRKDTEVPCNCIFRAIFRACLNRFRQCAISADHIGSVSLEFCRGAEGRRIYSRKREEFVADFCLVSRRSLDEIEYTLFKYHFLLGADWKLCCRRLKMDRGSFFHMVYRIEQKLGRIFCELKPYALYPLNEYFGGVIFKEPVTRSIDSLSKSKPFRPPIAA